MAGYRWGEEWENAVGAAGGENVKNVARMGARATVIERQCPRGMHKGRYTNHEVVAHLGGEEWGKESESESLARLFWIAMPIREVFPLHYVALALSPFR